MTRSISVTTGARLHFGPLSYAPQVGRHFGGVGVMIDDPGFRVSLRVASHDAILADQPALQRVRQFVKRYRESCPGNCQPPSCEISVESVIPSHSGLGSGTQLGLAVARGLAALAGEEDVTALELARRVGRGRRSAVGIHGFERGGLLVDAGQDVERGIGPLACRLAMPEKWRVLLITPQGESVGLSGGGEEHAFETLGSMPQSQTDQLCRIVLTELLPSVQAEDYARFSESLYEYGRLVGEFFAPVQGGTFGHPRADALIAELGRLGIAGAGQTSWGPTVFAFVPDRDTSNRVAASLARIASVDVRSTRLRNRGAVVEEPSPVSQR